MATLPPIVRKVAYLALLGLLVVLATRYMGKLQAKAGV